MNTKEQQKWNAARYLAHTTLDDNALYQAVTACELAAGWHSMDTRDVLQWIIEIQNGRPVEVDGRQYEMKNVYGCGCVYVAA